MDKHEKLKGLFKYFAKFVPKSVLQDMFKLPATSKEEGYDEFVTELMSDSDEKRLDDISIFVLSANSKYVSDQVKSKNDKIILFVEYGSENYNPNATKGIKERLAITVCREFNISNNDNLNEMLIMNQCYNLLTNIINQINKDQSQLEACGARIKFPVELIPVDPASFFDNCGWTAIFENEKTP